MKANRLISIIASAAVVLQSIWPALFLWVPPVRAQEATESATLIEPSPEPISTPAAEIVTSVEPPQTEVVSAMSRWFTLDDNTDVTTSNVVVNEDYRFRDTQVLIRFTKLPDPSGTLTIKKINLSTEQMEELGAVSDVAYDITSSMANGSFSYDLTLPLPESARGQPVEVKADGEIVDQPKEVKTETVIISGLDHFTVFVLVNDIDTDNPDDLGDSDDVANGVQTPLLEDTWVDQNQPTDTHGNSQDLYVRSDDEGNPDNNRRSFVKFDTSPIDDNSTINKATLRIFLVDAPGDSRTYEAYRVTSDWSESTLDWDPQPASVGPSDAIESGTQNNVWLEWDVTNDVQGLVNGDFDNFGWMIRDAAESNELAARTGKFNSSEDGNELRRPQLVVDFAESADEPTQYNSPSDEYASGGNGFENNSTGAFADGGGVASHTNNAAGESHVYYKYGFSIPAGATINGIEVRTDWYLDGNGGTNSLGVELSGDGGLSWTTTGYKDVTETDKEHVVSFGGSSDTWGRTWSASDFSNDSFRVKVTANTTSSGRDFFLDWIPVRVYYTPLTTGTLIVKKHVDNDNGGSMEAGDFNLHVSASDIDVSGSPAAGDEDGVSYTLEAGDYTVSEDNVSGYSSGFSGDCDDEGIVTVVAGETKTCTITNDDIAPVLTLVKEVVTDNGGQAGASDWTLSASGIDGSFSGAGPTVGPNEVFAGIEYTLEELGPDGYTASSWQCDGGFLDGNKLTLEPGDNVTCTIVNNDQAGTLIVRKVINNNNGGSKQADDFSFQVNGGATIVFEADGENELTVNAGTYSVAELETAGYDTSYDNCSDVTVANGGTATCTITNDDQPATLILVKNLPNDNGGTATEDDFPVYIDDEEVDWGENQVDAGSYTVSEDTLAGYTASEWGTDCDGDGSVILGPGETKTCTITNDDQPGEIHGAKFEDENGNGEWNEGESGLSGWTIFLDLNGNGELDGGEPSAETGDDGQYSLIDLAAGSYQVQEIVKDGWAQTTANPDMIDLGNGEIVEGINFGNFDLFTISGKKFNDLNGDGVRTNGETDPNLAGWTIQLDLVDNDSAPNCDTGSVNGEFCELVTDGFGNYSFSNLGPGKYRILEVLQDGWAQTAPTSESGLGGQDDGTYLVSGFSGVNRASRNFGNFQLGRISGVKFDDTNGNGVRDEGEAGLAEWTIYLDLNENGELDDGEPLTTTDAEGAYEFNGLSVGSYRVREVVKDGWTQTLPESGEYAEGVVSGSVLEGRDFGNFEDVTIIVYKWEDWDGDGEWDENEPAAEGWEMGVMGTSTEILSLNLTGATNNLGVAEFTVTQPGTYRLTEDSQTNWQRTHPSDSFFDVFVDLGGAKISHDKDGNELWFGNILFEDIFGGMFAPTNGNIDSTPGVTILGDTTITVPESGENTISFLDKTVITRSDGENFDISDLSGSAPALGSLTGLGSGVVADGALQWGLTDLGLEFSQPITVSIFVGTAFNGQTLNVLRSTSGSSGWTNDGIVAPATCTVTDGFCTFQATKASFYAATHTTSTGTTAGTSTTDGGGGGDGGAAACGDTKPGSAPNLTAAIAGVNSVTLVWTQAVAPVSYYLVTYGEASGAQTYGNPNVGGAGTTSYTVSGLSGGTTYYFKVRAGNGCMPGDYSGEISATPTGGFVAGPAAGFAPGVLGAATPSATPTTTPTASPATGGEVLGSQPGKRNWPWWILAGGTGLMFLSWYLYRYYHTSKV